MNSALELKIATGVRVVGRDMSTVPFSLSRRRSLRGRAVAASPAGASQNDVGTTWGGLRGAVSGAGGAPHCTSRRAVATFKSARVRASRLEGASRTCNESTVDL
jgi:hypothetical protein